MLVAIQNYEEELQKPKVTEESAAEEVPEGAEASLEAAPSAEDEAGAEAEVETSAEDQLLAAAEKAKSQTGRAEIQQALQELAEEYLNNPTRGILLTEVANAWQFRTRPENAIILRQFYQPKPTKISKPSLETLAIVAYRQPVTRAEIDAIRGVDSGGVLKTLLEKNLVRIVGKKDEPGKPMLYGSTQEFLELFQLKNLHELPTLKEFRELEEEFQRKTAAEGVVTENVESEVEEEESLIEGDSVQQMIAVLDEEEEEAFQDLEASLKDLRDVERDIFAEEKAEEKAAAAATPQDQSPES
ncbi:MAG: SMC-Scp complex subunit ScpB [Deltaproteobacteria bacterium]|nr:SMC-Scp complex subunit ScpB [Deltaproteobacteria bacterium]